MSETGENTGENTVAKHVKGPRPKHVANRICIACRESAGKRALIRIVRTPSGIEVDTSGKKAGRGAYLHPQGSCWHAALESRRIEQALRVRLSAPDRQMLEDFAATLPDRTPDAVPVDNGTADVSQE